MPRYWVIAPYGSKDQAIFDRVWQFDLSNGFISLGWNELGDVSNLDRTALASAVAKTYPASPLATKSLFANMLWAFFREIVPGDIVIARRGRKMLAAIGTVTKQAAYAPGTNPALTKPPHAHSNYLGVKWHDTPRDLSFDSIVFPMHTLMEIDEAQFHSLVEGKADVAPPAGQVEPIEDASAFALEKYLEEFIVSNFSAIFKGDLALYEDADGSIGQQFTTDIGPIDILAVEPATGSYVVIELKKGRPSDQVVGQVLRYMGWVKEKLCVSGQSVKGLVICKEPDLRLTYALSMTNIVEVKYYSVSFKLRDAP